MRAGSILVEDLPGYVELHKIPTQRPAHERLALKPAQNRKHAHDQRYRDSHPAQRPSFAASRQRSKPMHRYPVNRREW